MPLPDMIAMIISPNAAIMPTMVERSMWENLELVVFTQRRDTLVPRQSLIEQMLCHEKK
jgi:hypothetical protein